MARGSRAPEISWAACRFGWDDVFFWQTALSWMMWNFGCRAALRIDGDVLQRAPALP